jgi:PTH1 family peptidyl-tRNA hydrolase
MNAVALRTAPPRSSTSAPDPTPAEKPAPEATKDSPVEDSLSPLQRLLDRFR